MFAEIKRLLRVYGPDVRGAGRFRLFGWPAEKANEKHMVVDIWQILGSKRWSFAVIHTIKTAEED